MQLITFFLLLLFNFSFQTSAEPCSAAFNAAILARHNYYRTLHSSTPPLALNSSLNFQAQQWAEQILTTGVFRHRPNRRLSENLFRQVTPGTEAEVSAKVVVDAWYSESEFYGEFYGREPDLATFSSWRYFTAMIWASSRELGVGCATKLLENDASNSQSRITYVVTNYSPRGNVVREFAENVRRPRVKTTTTSTTTTAFSTYKSTSKALYSTSTSKPPYRKPSPKPVSMPTKPYTPSTTAKPPPPPSFYSTAAAAAATKYRPRSTTKAYQQTTRKTSAIFYGSSSSTTAATKTYAKKTTTTKAYKTTKAAYKTSTTAKTAYKKTTTTTKKPVKYTKYTTKTTTVPITTTTPLPSTAEEYPYHPEALPPSSPYDPLGHPQNPYHHPNPQPSYPLLSNYYRPPLPPPPPPPPQYPSIFSHEDLMDLHEAVYLQRPRPILRPPVHLNIDDLRDLQNNQVKGSGKNKNKNKNKEKPLFDYDPQNDVYNLVGNHAHANSNSTFTEEYSAATSTNKPVFYLPANYQPALQKPPPPRPAFPFKPLPLSSFLHLLPNSYQQSPAQNTYQQQPFFRPSFYRPVYRPVTAQRVIYKHQMQEQQQNQKKKKVKSVEEADNIKEKVEHQEVGQKQSNLETPAA